MKKVLQLLVLICLISSILIGCRGESPTKAQDAVHEQENVKEQEDHKESNQELITEQTEEQSDSKSDDQTVVPTIQELSRDEWIGKNIKVEDKNLIEASIEFAEMYINERYKDFKVSIDNVEPQNGYSVWGLSDVVEGGKVNCSITFTTVFPVKGLDKSTNKRYTGEIIVLMIKKGNEIYLSGYLDKGDYDSGHQQRFLYTYFKEDNRFEQDIKGDLLDSITEIDLSSIVGDLIMLEQVMVTENLLAVICRENTEKTNSNLMYVKFYDIKENSIKTITIEDCNFSSLTNVSVKENKLIIGIEEQNIESTVDSDQTTYRYSQKKVTIDLDGNVNIDELTFGDEKLYSPDKKSYIYTNKASIYYSDDRSNNSQLLLKGIDSMDTDVDYYYPYKWIDEERFVYGRTGYEWSNGCGIYNIKEQKDYPLANAGFWPIAVRGSKLFIEESDGVINSLGIIDLNDNNKITPILSEDVLKPGFIIEQVAISPDGNIIVFLTHSWETQTCELIFWSIKEGKSIKTYKLVNTIADPSRVSFINNNTLLIYSTRWWACDEYIRIMKVDDLFDEEIEKTNTYGEASRRELAINDYQVDEQLLKPNRLLRTINDCSVTNSVDITSHDFIHEKTKDLSIKKINSNDLKQDVITLERMDNNLFDTYTNILLPRLVKDGIVFFVQDILDSSVYYLMKYEFHDKSIQLIYTIDGSNYKRFSLEQGYYSVKVKTTDNYMICRLYNDIIIYDIENNSIASHIRYSEQITDDVFDISGDGQLIAFINKEGSLIVSDILMKKPKLIMKAYLDSNNNLKESMPRYPHFSITNPHLLTYRLQGYEWSYGDMLYNVLDESLIKLPEINNEETYKEWVSGDFILAADMYESYTYGFINLQNEYITIDKDIERVNYNVDYGFSTSLMGIPLYDKNKRLVFLDIENKELTEIENIQMKEEYVSLSSDRQYLITRTNGETTFELSKIIYKQ